MFDDTACLDFPCIDTLEYGALGGPAGTPPMRSRENACERLSSIGEILDDARAGKMFILVDSPNRENEGDLVLPAQFATASAINFMASYGRGLICLAITQERACELELAPMVAKNRTRMGTAFTVSIEAAEGVSTGISAHDRAHTIATAVDPGKGATDLVSPGHVFPLVARQGGVLERAGHTEATVDVARIAGLIPAAVICEIMNDDGTMARLPDLLRFARIHGLRIGSIAELIAWRSENEGVQPAMGGFNDNVG